MGTEVTRQFYLPSDCLLSKRRSHLYINYVRKNIAQNKNGRAADYFMGVQARILCKSFHCKISLPR